MLLFKTSNEEEKECLIRNKEWVEVSWFLLLLPYFVFFIVGFNRPELSISLVENDFFVTPMSLLGVMSFCLLVFKFGLLTKKRELGLKEIIGSISIFTCKKAYFCSISSLILVAVINLFSLAQIGFEYKNIDMKAEWILVVTSLLFSSIYFGLVSTVSIKKFKKIG